MYDLQDLYQEVVMDHNRRPRNFHKVDDANRTSEGFNPLCGDQITLYLKIDDNDVIEDVGFEGVGCAISKASSSMMTESIKGKTVAEAERIFAEVRHMLTRKRDEDFDADLLGDLELLEGVVEYPARIKCANLSWHTLSAALKNGQKEKVSTE